MNILIRDVGDDIVAKLDTEAAKRGLSRQELLTEVLTRLYGNPPLVIGWFKADRPGELDDAECVECSQPLESVWLGVLSNGAWYGPVCAGCATSE